MVRILGGNRDGTFLASKTEPQRLYCGPLGPPSQILSHGRVPPTMVIMTVMVVLGSVTVMPSSQSFRN